MGTKELIKIGALTSGLFTPSTRFRIRQHIIPLKEYGISVQELRPLIDRNRAIPGWPQNLRQRYLGLVFPVYAAWQFAKVAASIPAILRGMPKQMTWLSRQIVPGFLTLEPVLRKPLIYDVDDAIWLGGPLAALAASTTARISDLTVVGNAYLADWYSKHTNRIRIVPTSVDSDKYAPIRRGRDSSDSFTVGWVGTGGNLPYLEAIERPLSAFLTKRPDARLLIVCDRFPHLRSLPNRSVVYEPWSEDTEVKSFHRIHLGLMPLSDNDSTRGKCSFKMLQYMSCAIPVVASPVGMNREVLNQGTVGIPATKDDEWYEAIEHIYQNPSLAKKMGREGREIITDKYDRKIVTARIASIFRSII
jgi:glycosyltransferase involved in cell wall biosynthesis